MFFLVERLCDFLLLRGCMIFLCMERLHDFVYVIFCLERLRDLFVRRG